MEQQTAQLEVDDLNVDELQVDDLEVPEEGPGGDAPVSAKRQGPDPSEAEVQAKEGSAPDLSAPKLVVVVPSEPAMTLKQAKEKFVELNAEYEELRKSRDVCDAKMTVLHNELKILKPYVADAIDPQESQRSIMRYVKNQGNIRREKAEKINKVLQGLKLQDILPNKGSKLDQSMARKIGLGLRRPQYPTSNKG